MPWMTDLFYDPALEGAPLGPFRNRSLHQITLPGTHDSGCYRDQRISNVYSATQTQDIFQQLAGGVRYFDLRPCARGTTFWRIRPTMGRPQARSSAQGNTLFW